MARAREREKERRTKDEAAYCGCNHGLDCDVEKPSSLSKFDKNRSSFNTKCRWTTGRVKAEYGVLSGIAPLRSNIVACSSFKGR